MLIINDATLKLKGFREIRKPQSNVLMKTMQVISFPKPYSSSIIM